MDLAGKWKLISAVIAVLIGLPSLFLTYTNLVSQVPTKNWVRIYVAQAQSESLELIELRHHIVSIDRLIASEDPDSEKYDAQVSLRVVLQARMDVLMREHDND